MSEELRVTARKTREELFDAMQEFVSDIGGVYRELDDHELDMHGFSQEVNQLIEEFLDANFN